MSPFTDPHAVADYAARTQRLVPGLVDLHRMTQLLLAERVPATGHILVLGAGGGLELKVFADAQPDWHLTGVDPAAEMLQLARATLGPLAERVQLCEGYIADAPAGPFDGATCLLTLHFLPAHERLQTLRQVYQRLSPGAPFVVAHHSFAQQEPEREQWLDRYAAFAGASGVAPAQALKGRPAIGTRLPVLTPAQDEALLREAGFSQVQLFYAAFTFRGWVAYK